LAALPCWWGGRCCAAQAPLHVDCKQHTWQGLLSKASFPSSPSRFPPPLGLVALLQVFRLVAAISRELSAPGLPAIFVHAQRTIRAQAAALEEEYRSGTLLTGGSAASRLRGRTVARLLLVPGKWDDNTRPLSANQQQMWVLYQSGAHAAYNIPVCMRMHGLVDEAALRLALNTVAARHENLRWDPAAPLLLHYACLP
jgi:hypothetical protein